MIPTMTCFLLIQIIAIHIKMFLICYLVAPVLLALILAGFEKINDFFIQSNKITTFFESRYKVDKLCNFLAKIPFILFLCFEIFYTIEGGKYFVKDYEKNKVIYESKDETRINDLVDKTFIKMLKHSVYLEYKGEKND